MTLAVGLEMSEFSPKLHLLAASFDGSDETIKFSDPGSPIVHSNVPGFTLDNKRTTTESVSSWRWFSTASPASEPTVHAFLRVEAIKGARTSWW